MKSKIHKPKSIEEAIKDLLEFFECDMWYAKDNEWKNEKEMIKYLRCHFKILQKQVRNLRRKK